MLLIDGDGSVQSIDVELLIPLPLFPPPINLQTVLELDESAAEPATETLHETPDDVAHANRQRPLLQKSRDQAPLSMYFQHTSYTMIILVVIAIGLTTILEHLPGMLILRLITISNKSLAMLLSFGLNIAPQSFLYKAGLVATFMGGPMYGFSSL